MLSNLSVPHCINVQVLLSQQHRIHCRRAVGFEWRAAHASCRKVIPRASDVSWCYVISS